MQVEQPHTYSTTCMLINPGQTQCSYATSYGQNAVQYLSTGIDIAGRLGQYACAQNKFRRD